MSPRCEARGVRTSGVQERRLQLRHPNLMPAVPVFPESMQVDHDSLLGCCGDPDGWNYLCHGLFSSQIPIASLMRAEKSSFQNNLAFQNLCKMIKCSCMTASNPVIKGTISVGCRICFGAGVLRDMALLNISMHAQFAGKSLLSAEFRCHRNAFMKTTFLPTAN